METWNELETCAEQLASQNDPEIWDDLFPAIQSITDSDKLIHAQLTPPTFETPNIDSDFTFLLMRNKLKSNPHNSMNFDILPLPDIMPQIEYCQKIQLFNKQQRKIFDDCIYHNEHFPEKPLYLFLTGGAGTGKTFTSLLILQALLRGFVCTRQNL